MNKRNRFKMKNKMMKRRIPDPKRSQVHFRSGTADRLGFTLVEMVVAMTIFSLFITMLVASYTNLTQAQSRNIVERQVYSELRDSMDLIVTEFMQKTIDYSCYNLTQLSEIREECVDAFPLNGMPTNVLATVNQANTERTIFKIADDRLQLMKTNYDSDSKLWFPADGFEDGFVDISSKDMNLSTSNFVIHPLDDPYAHPFEDGFQFQPSVKIYLESNLSNRLADFNYDLDTVVSSRVYGPINKR